MKYKKAMFSLPEPLLKQIEKYAGTISDGNKSGFMAKAAEAYIDYLHRIEYTKKMREAYKASAKDSLRIAHEWRHVDAELAQRLDDEETKRTSKRRSISSGA